MTRRAMATPSSTSVDGQLAELMQMDHAALQERWQAVFGRPAPLRVRRDLLQRIIAYRIQEKAYGGLSPAAVQQLRRVADGLKDGASSSTAPSTPSLTAGAKLMREWNGETHVVDVTAAGFAWRSKVYRSLSVIAREITGARWSGPRFFGLKDARK